MLWLTNQNQVIQRVVQYKCYYYNQNCIYLAQNKEAFS